MHYGQVHLIWGLSYTCPRRWAGAEEGVVCPRTTVGAGRSESSSSIFYHDSSGATHCLLLHPFRAGRYDSRAQMMIGTLVLTNL